MATQAVLNDSGEGKKYSITSKVYDIVSAPTVSGGTCDICGHCGEMLRTGAEGQAAREEMNSRVSDRILDPLGLLAGLCTQAEAEDVSPVVFGNLLGLIVNGARKEMEIQTMGGDAAYALEKFLNPTD